MKIYMLDPSGFSVFYDHHLCQALQEENADVTLWTRHPRRNERTYSGAYTTVFRFYRLSEWLIRHLHHLPWTLNLIRLLKGIEHFVDLCLFLRRVRKDNPQVIHFQWLALPLFDRWALRRVSKDVRRVHTVHDLKPFLGAVSSRLQTLGWLKTIREFDRLIVHSEESRDTLANWGLDRSIISVVPIGPIEIGETQPSLDHPSGKTHKMLPNQSQPMGNRKTVLLYGNLKEYKGPDLLIEAYSRIPKKVRKDWVIRFLGRAGMSMEGLFKRAKELDLEEDVVFDLRYVSEEELSLAISNSSILAFPYREIDASGALMTGLRFGRPLLASNIGVFRRLIKDGESGRLFDAEDIDSLAEALEELMKSEELRNRLGLAAQDILKTIESWPSIARKTLHAYSH